MPKEATELSLHQTTGVARPHLIVPRWYVTLMATPVPSADDYEGCSRLGMDGMVCWKGRTSAGRRWIMGG